MKSQLIRKENEFIHQKVDTICIKNFKETYNHLGRRIGPFKVGHPYRLDHYISRIFVEEGFLEFNNGGNLTRKSIQKINFQESTNPELKKIQKYEYLYTQAREQLEITNKLFKNGTIPRLDFKQLYSDVNDLIRVRLAKINRLAIQSRKLESNKLLTSEEQILFNELSSKIDKWREHLGSIKE